MVVTNFLSKLTLKALANSSPGLRFGNPGTTHPISRSRNSKELLGRFINLKAAQPLAGLRSISLGVFEPRVSKQTLG
jgi:hypothetical protein